MKILLTNDDGINAIGLHAMRRALLEVPGVELAVIAPGLQPQRDRAQHHHPQAALGRGDRVRRRHHRLRHRRHAGGLRALRRARPDRVRAGADRLRHQPRLQPRRRHHLLGHGGRRARGDRARASRRSRSPSRPSRREVDFRAGRHWEPRTSRPAARVRRADRRGAGATCRCPRARCSTSTARRARSSGARACQLGKRIYRDRLELAEEEDGPPALPHLRRRARLPRTRTGTDFAAIADGQIAVTPLHFDLTDEAGIEELVGLRPRAGCCAPAAREV